MSACPYIKTKGISELSFSSVIYLKIRTGLIPQQLYFTLTAAELTVRNFLDNVDV